MTCWSCWGVIITTSGPPCAYSPGLGADNGIGAGFVWLLALGSLYSMGWWKALGVAIVVWVVAFLVGFILPTVVGPL